MRKILKQLGKAAKTAGAKALDFYRAYPARCNGAIAAAIVFGAGAFGAVLDQQKVAVDVAMVLPILLAAEATHRKVKPVR